ncbi:putative disease resistance protein RGA3 [Coffea eugenioides]|uniref:putative disease resistance protein RGA3 n=1 Tax=Coffea eugenioides TaxID=49369 RepID=UPI000F60AF41|nr:putative disease resistance protein RGA3 [Coffea eugenioides]
MTRISSSPCSLKKLPDDECWLILKENAFGAGKVPDGMQDIGCEIAKKYQGVPLAASVPGSILRNKGSDERLSILETGLQNLGGDEKLSVHHLPSPSLKNCFAYCSIFPKDIEINRSQLLLTLGSRKISSFKSKKQYGDGGISIFNYKPLRLKGTRTYYDETLSTRYLATEKSDEEIPFPLHESFRSDEVSTHKLFSQASGYYEVDVKARLHGTEFLRGRIYPIGNTVHVDGNLLVKRTVHANFLEFFVELCKNP